MSTTIELATDLDITQARQLGRAMAREQGFSAIDQARLATAVSELARDFFLYSETVALVSLRSLTDGERRGIEVRLQGSGSTFDALLAEHPARNCPEHVVSQVEGSIGAGVNSKF